MKVATAEWAGRIKLARYGSSVLTFDSARLIYSASCWLDAKKLFRFKTRVFPPNEPEISSFSWKLHWYLRGSRKYIFFSSLTFFLDYILSYNQNEVLRELLFWNCWLIRDSAKEVYWRILNWEERNTALDLIQGSNNVCGREAFFFVAKLFTAGQKGLQ